MDWRLIGAEPLSKPMLEHTTHKKFTNLATAVAIFVTKAPSEKTFVYKSAKQVLF